MAQNLLNKLKSLLRRSGRGTKAGALAPHLALGQRGERLAAAHLEQQGYRLVARNFVLPVGRNQRGVMIHAELDLVAYDGPTLCFIEVKTRTSDWFADPEANVDARKQRQISRAARAYRRFFGQHTTPHRYDVVSIVLPEQDDSLTAPRLEILKDFWRDDKFRKTHWRDEAFTSSDY